MLISFAPSCAYRVKPQPLTKPRIGDGTRADWERYLPEWAMWIAADERGGASMYSHEPIIVGRNTYWTSREGLWRPGSGFRWISPGTCDWRDSLVRKPEQ